MAFRSFVTARCSIVPALETETPRTAASSALSRPAWNFSAISSRSRGASAGERGAQRGAAQRRVGGVLRRGRVGVGRLGGQGGAALAAAQLVERGVARDAEQPRALAAARGLVGALLAVRTLERARRHVLGRRAVAEQRRDVGEHVVARGAVEGVEVESGVRPGGGESGGSGCWSHRYYDARQHPSRKIRVDVFDGTLRPHPHRCSSRPSAAPARADDADLWATVNVCDTAAHPNEIGIRASMPGGKRAHAAADALPRAVPRPLRRPLARGAATPTRAGARPARARRDARVGLELRGRRRGRRGSCAAWSTYRWMRGGPRGPARARLTAGRPPLDRRRRPGGLQRRHLPDLLSQQDASRGLALARRMFRGLTLRCLGPLRPEPHTTGGPAHA